MNSDDLAIAISRASREIGELPDEWLPLFFKGWHSRAQRHVIHGLPLLYRAARRAGLGTAIQAGGCTGLYPYLLSLALGTVYTFEPDPDNFEVLVRNLETLGTGEEEVFAFNAALVEQSRTLRLHKDSINPGATSVEGDEAGDVVGIALDEALADPETTLDLEDLTLVQLDVEGAEQDALLGMQDLIKRLRPVIMIETCNDKYGATHDMLVAWGYDKVDGNEYDAVYAWQEDGRVN